MYNGQSQQRQATKRIKMVGSAFLSHPAIGLLVASSADTDPFYG